MHTIYISNYFVWGADGALRIGHVTLHLKITSILLLIE